MQQVFDPHHYLQFQSAQSDNASIITQRGDRRSPNVIQHVKKCGLDKATLDRRDKPHLKVKDLSPIPHLFQKCLQAKGNLEYLQFYTPTKFCHKRNHITSVLFISNTTG